jgi:hypothetical protein
MDKPETSRMMGREAQTSQTSVLLCRSLSVSDAYLRTIESPISIALVSLLIWKSRLQVAINIAER